MSETLSANMNGQPLLHLRVVLRRGEASTFVATFPPGANVPQGAVTLEVGDAHTRREFRQFSVERVESLGDGRRRVYGADLRLEWRREVTLDANLPDGDGTAWRDGEPLTVQAVTDRMFAAAGLDAPALQPGLPAPAGVRARGRLDRAFGAMLAGVGATVSVDDAGEVRFADADAAPSIDASTIIETAESAAAPPSSIHLTGGPAIELTEVTDWQTVMPEETGTLRPLSEVLSEWGISEHDARQACLSDGGFDKLLPKTGPNAGTRLSLLRRYAFRLLRSDGGWLPVGGVGEGGEFIAPRVVATVVRGRGVAPDHPSDDGVEELTASVIEEFELDPPAGTLYLPRPPFALDQLSPSDPTLQARRVAGDARVCLTIALHSTRPPFTLAIAGTGDAEAEHLHAPHLVAVYDHDGKLLNGDRLAVAARALAQPLLQSRATGMMKLAGVADALAVGTCRRVIVEAGADGLITTIEQSPVTAAPATALQPRAHNAGHPAGPAPSGLYQPMNAFRAGPLVLRASGETPEGEGVLVMEATHRDGRTGALTLEHPGSLAFPFFLASEDASRFGRWFFVAGVEVAASGRLRVLAPDDRHGEVHPGPIFEARHVLPHGLRGLIVSLGDEPRFADTGPLIADARGREPGASSSLVYDLDESRLSERKRGGLQFLTVLALSPAHRAEGARDGGWAPALNLREGETANSETTGRGLFAEGHGRDLGRLTAKQQGGPILADGQACAKHLYGSAADDDGLYRETAGHISTEAFFKVPGDPVHDAPVKFYAEKFEGAVPPWTPFEAQLKYDANERHPWNRTTREGRWKIQYRVPFLPEVPPTWDPPIGPPQDPPTDEPSMVPVPLYVPRDIRPAVSEYELWAPSHDWVPAPSARDGQGPVTFPGPSIKSEGWAGETNGQPAPSLGGGCIYLPPGVAMPDAQDDNGERQTFLLLHPQVALAIGHPDFANGRAHSGWAIQLAASGGNLELLPRDIDASTPPGTDRGVRVTGHLAVGPSGATFDDSQALRLGAGDGEGIAFGEDVQLYRETEGTLRTDGSLEVGGKLTVEGLIDPTGLELEPQPENPGGAPANTLWVSSSDGRARIGAQVLAFTPELAGKRIECFEYTGSGLSGKTVALTGINRAHALLIFRDDAATAGCLFALPMGDTGATRVRDLAGGGADTDISLDAPGAGVAQTLTINSIDGSRNAEGVSYRLLVIGTHT
jgi:hypothetical protein